MGTFDDTGYISVENRIAGGYCNTFIYCIGKNRMGGLEDDGGDTRPNGRNREAGKMTCKGAQPSDFLCIAAYF